MNKTIAVVGKGGTGKTTISGMLIKYLIHQKKHPILAVDADANANLNEVLGMQVNNTLGDAREEMKKGKVPKGMTKNTFISMKLQEAIIEKKYFDLLVMGQPEGSGCYCAANSLLSSFLEKLTNNYPYTIIDNEAGMEHISRLTVKKANILLIITDTSRRSIQSGIKINKLTKKLNIEIDETYLIINKTKSKIDNNILKIINENKINFAGSIPENEEIYNYDLQGMATINIDKKNESIKKAFNIFNKIIY